MKNITRKFRRTPNQTGVFIIEFAFVLLAFSFVIVFTMDLVAKQSVKGKLDRLSYSLVSVLRERTQLFDGDETMSYQEATKAYNLIRKSLRSTLAPFEESRLSVLIEQQRFDEDKNPISQNTNEHIFRMGSYACPAVTPLTNMQDLTPITQFDNRLTLYQVTLCYRTDNWFGSLVDEEYERVRSASISFGR